MGGYNNTAEIKTKNLEFHEVANVFPLMNWQDYQILKFDISENGLREAIVVHNGRIVDGRHRYRACLELGIEPKLREWDQEGSLVAFAVSMNLHRRHLTASQRAMLAAEIKPLFEQEARKRQGVRKKVSANLREVGSGKASEQAGQLVSVSARSVESASKVKRLGIPELVEAVRHGDIAVSMAAKVADLPYGDQLKIAESGTKREMREVARNVNRPDMKQPEISEIESEQSIEDFRCIFNLLKNAKDILADRDAGSVAKALCQKLTLSEKQLIKENIKGARLFHEIYQLCSQENAKAT